MVRIDAPGTMNQTLLPPDTRSDAEAFARQ